MNEIINLHAKKLAEKIRQQEIQIEHDNAMLHDLTYNGRQYGNTTRFIDECIQNLFTKGECCCIEKPDDEYKNTHARKVRDKIVRRLEVEHNIQQSELNFNNNNWTIAFKP